MSKLHLVPKTSALKVDAPRPLTSKERARLRKENGGDATAEQLARLADKFGRKHPERVSREDISVVETINYFDGGDAA